MTQQILDNVIFEQKRYHAVFSPLEHYFFLNPPTTPPTLFSTALYRNYVATYEVVGKTLTLKEFSSWGNFDLDFLKPTTPNSTYKYEMSWFSGLIHISENFDQDWELRKDQNPSYVSQFLEFKKGQLVQKRSMDNPTLEHFKNEQYEYFKISDEYEPLVEKIKQAQTWCSTEQAEKIIKNSILYFLTEIF